MIYYETIEDEKRECEQMETFDPHFIELSRAVYILNDQRAHLKRLINKYMDSGIKEYKSHKEY